MSLKRFGPNDLIYSSLVAKPEFRFIIHSGSSYRDSEILADGDFTNKIKHMDNGEISLHELNINRPSDSLIRGYIEKSTTRYAHRKISTSQFDDSSQFQYGAQLTQSYPITASLTRIFIDEGPEFDQQNFQNIGSATFAATNKRYIRALKNVIDNAESFGKSLEYADLGTRKVNIVGIPGIFYGSRVDPGSVKLSYYITGTLTSRLEDSRKDGTLVETFGQKVGAIAGHIIYNHGIVILTGSWDLSNGSYTDNFFSKSSVKSPSWLSFGTGLPIVGDSVEFGSNISSSYGIDFKGTNKIPTLTMFAFSKKNEQNYSINPTFLESSSVKPLMNDFTYQDPDRNIKNITKSDFVNHSASFVNTTFITKIGIYDKDKNLIAIASLANPAKKTPDRDYMFKMRVDF